MRRKIFIITIGIAAVVCLAIGGTTWYVIADNTKKIKGDGIELAAQSDGRDILVTSGWPRRMGRARPCIINVKEITGNLVSYTDSDVLISLGSDVTTKLGGECRNGQCPALVAHGDGIGDPLIGMSTPEDAAGALIDAIGCEWRFPKAMSFSFKSIQFTAKPGARISFENDAVRLSNVEISGQ